MIANNEPRDLKEQLTHPFGVLNNRFYVLKDNGDNLRRIND